MMFKKKSTKNLFISFIIIVIFLFLMIFGLKRNPNFTPSMLIGKSAPPISAQLSSGEQFNFNTNNKSWTVINFWSSSCYVCREEASELQNFYQTVSAVNKNNPQFLSINIEDDTKSILQWQKDYAQTFPVVEDKNGAISINYGVTGTPETFFIDEKNIVRYRISGSLNRETILNTIAKLK